MNIFVNDKPARIIELSDSLLDEAFYHVVLHASTDVMKSSMLHGHVLITNASAAFINKLFGMMREKKMKRLASITFAVRNKKAMVSAVKEEFRIIKAGGGLVLKDDKVLMMFRLGKWDLPKGKLEKNEKSKQGALREVEEECNIAVQLDYKICSTWHTYNQNGNRMLKKTKWYAMTCLDDSHMRPQVEENIEHLVWMSREEAQVALYNSYASIRHVFDVFYAKQGTKTV